MRSKAFDWQGNKVNTVIIDERTDQPWFVAKEVCDILELTNPSVSLKSLDDGEKMKLRIPSFQKRSPIGRGGDSGVRVMINESGLYTLIMRSGKPDAQKFRKWVTGEVRRQPPSKWTRLLPLSTCHM